MRFVRCAVAMMLFAGVVAAQGYVVAAAVGADDPYFAAARRLEKLHPGAEIVRLDPGNLEPLRKRLAEIAPRNVAVVVRPETLEWDLVRRFLVAATRLDDDPFVDFDYGWITGRTAGDAVALVERAASVSARPLTPRIVQMAAGEASRRSTGFFPLRPRMLRFTFVEVQGDGSGMRRGASHDRKFVAEQRKLLREATAVTFIGHGWPDEVCGVLDTHDLAGMQLDDTVVLNVACYTGVTSRWYEDDRGAGVVRAREVPPDRSFALEVIHRGAVGYSAFVCVRPSGPEMDAELSELIAGGATLGAARRRDYDKTVLGFLGYGVRRLTLDPVRDGAPARPLADPVRDVMLEGATGGIVFGDPALRPFDVRPGGEPVHLEIRHEPERDRIVVDAACSPAALVRLCSDQTARFGESMAMRVYARVPLGEHRVAGVSVERLRLGRVQKTTHGSRGVVPQHRVLWAAEEDQGERYVQLKVLFARPRFPGFLTARIVVATTDDPAAEVRFGDSTH